MNPFKDVFKDCDHKFTQPLSRTHIFMTQSIFNKRRSVAGYRPQNFTNYLSEIKLRIQFLANFPWIFFSFFAYDETVTTSSRIIFAFTIFVLFIFNVLMVRKEELFIEESPKLQ